jgi:hypothetical protein
MYSFHLSTHLNGWPKEGTGTKITFYEHFLPIIANGASLFSIPMWHLHIKIFSKKKCHYVLRIQEEVYTFKKQGKATDEQQCQPKRSASRGWKRNSWTTKSPEKICNLFGAFVLHEKWIIQTRVDAKRIETLGLSLSKPKSNAPPPCQQVIPVGRFKKQNTSGLFCLPDGIWPRHLCHNIKRGNDPKRERVRVMFVNHHQTVVMFLDH